MDLNKLGWLIWIIGTIIIVLSWTDTVSGTVGWVGFGIAVVGIVISGISRRPKPPGEGGDPTIRKSGDTV